MAIAIQDYSLTGASGKHAVESGLADAIWYTSPIPRDEMRKLLVRRDGPAIRDTLIWFGLLGGSGYLGYLLWGSFWAVLPFLLYGVIYASSSDSRWHECSHGTAFKTDWMNEALYEIASFMQVRESVVWRWSHTRHHTDTIIVGRDPEIAVPRPANLKNFILAFIKLPAAPSEIGRMFIHATGRMEEQAATYVPESEWTKVYWRARIYLMIYGVAIGSALYLHSWLPLMYVGLPSLYGTWLMTTYGLTQHAGLAENVTDHRLNSRTIYMNTLNRYLYWNMNYHVEHHMFPMVPYHALPRLHELMKDDCLRPYKGLFEAWQEIIPAVIRQSKDPEYFVERELPTPSHQAHREATAIFSTEKMDSEGWIRVCDAAALQSDDAVRFDYQSRTFAVYRTEDGALYATDGMCTHGNAHLADGMIIGTQIECPKHNGRFDINDGSVRRAPPCAGLRTYPLETRGGSIFLNIKNAGGAGAEENRTHSFRVVSNNNVATFIKELILELEESSLPFRYQPGDYIQLDIPEFEDHTLADLQIDEPYVQAWHDQHLFDKEVVNLAPTRRNYSLATNPDKDSQLRFNIRFAAPPIGQQAKAGIGSSYAFSLKPGDRVSAIGPFGDFRIKEGESEMIYVGGGAGMAPLRSHLSYLLETQQTTRRISFWYGARSQNEMFYVDYFQWLAERYDNFRFIYAFSEASEGDDPAITRGFINDVLRGHYLKEHPSPEAVQYYLCGPPAMMEVTRGMLENEFKVREEQIAYDEF